MSDNEKSISAKEQELFRHFRLGEHLLQRSKITIDQLEKAIQEQQSTGKLIGEIFVEKGIISKDELEEGLGHQSSANKVVDNIKSSVKGKLIFKEIKH